MKRKRVKRREEKSAERRRKGSVKECREVRLEQMEETLLCTLLVKGFVSSEVNAKEIDLLSNEEYACIRGVCNRFWRGKC